MSCADRANGGAHTVLVCLRTETTGINSADAWWVCALVVGQVFGRRVRCEAGKVCLCVLVELFRQWMRCQKWDPLSGGV